MLPAERGERGLARRTAIVASTAAALGFGAAAYFGGVTGIAILGGGRTTGMPAAETPDAPNTPDIDVIVDDTSTWRVTFSTFVGSGADTQDSISVTVLRSAAADTLFHAVSGTQTADTISDNTDLKSDTTYRVLGRQKGASGGWSVADTLSVTNTVAALTVIFHSDWSSGTGNSSGVLRDSTKSYPWDFVKGNAAGSHVTDSVDWMDALPEGTNAFSTIHHTDGNFNVGVRLDGSLPELQANDERGFRFYLKVIMPDNPPWGEPEGDDNSVHPFQDGIGGSNTNFEFDIVDCGGGNEWQAHFESITADVGFQSYTIDGVTHESCTGAAALPKDSVFRFEMLQTMHSSGDSVDYEFRLYNADGTIRVDSDRFIRPTGAEDSSDEVTWVDSPTNATKWANHRSLQLGSNGWGQGDAPSPYIAWHWGAVAICEGWCGAYPITGVEN